MGLMSLWPKIENEEEQINKSEMKKGGWGAGKWSGPKVFCLGRRPIFSVGIIF